MKNQEAKPEVPFLDSTKHAYSEGVNVEIPGTLLFSLIKIISRLAAEETSMKYIINPESLNATAQPANLKEVISPDGVMYFSILSELEKVHNENVKAGKTIPVEELQKKVQEKIQKELEKMKNKEGVIELPTGKKKKK